MRRAPATSDVSATLAVEQRRCWTRCAGQAADLSVVCLLSRVDGLSAPRGMRNFGLGGDGGPGYGGTVVPVMVFPGLFLTGWHDLASEFRGVTLLRQGRIGVLAVLLSSDRGRQPQVPLAQILNGSDGGLDSRALSVVACVVLRKGI